MSEARRRREVSSRGKPTYQFGVDCNGYVCCVLTVFMVRVRTWILNARLLTATAALPPSHPPTLNALELLKGLRGLEEDAHFLPYEEKVSRH